MPALAYNVRRLTAVSSPSGSVGRSSLSTLTTICLYSGKPRPGYRDLLDALRASFADAVIAWHPDRLHHHPVELEEFVDICQTYNVAVQTVRAGAVDLSTASGQMVARMLGAAARYEVDHARERMKRAKTDAASSGRWRGGRRPFGYAEDGTTVVEREAASLLWAANQIVAGASLAATARRMTAEGMRTTTNRPIDSVALRRLLQRPRNAGLVDHKGEIIGAANWSAIIPEDTWRAVVGILGDPRRVTTTGPERVWLGSGIYRCGSCGAPMRVSLSGSTESSRAKVYTCRASKHVVRRCSDVDEIVRRVIEQRLAKE
ncbi:MAG: recombinase family protein, partial [Actinomycetota bacterium]|nr:recombinase family protein [Actinomycetota bacterium]